MHLKTDPYYRQSFGYFTDFLNGFYIVGGTFKVRWIRWIFGYNTKALSFLFLAKLHFMHIFLILYFICYTFTFAKKNATITCIISSKFCKYHFDILALALQLQPFSSLELQLFSSKSLDLASQLQLQTSSSKSLALAFQTYNVILSIKYKNI